MTKEEAIDNLFNEIETPDGKMILYGLNFLPNSENFGLIFYKDGKQVIFWMIDCKIINNN